MPFLPKFSSKPSKWFLFGMLFGPFVATFFIVLAMAAIGWKSELGAGLGWLNLAVPLGIGVYCWIRCFSPRGGEWIWLAPYALVYFALGMGFSIVLLV